MNKHEAIKKVEQMGEYERFVNESIPKLSVLNILNQLDEPQKVKVPQFVADWIKYCKNTNLTMTRALIVDEVDFHNYANQEDFSKLKKFLATGNNQEIFVRAWLDGYTIKEERYLVKMKGLSEYTSYLNYDSIDDKWHFADAENGPVVGTHHTREQLEKAGFGWVFDCPGVEVREVEE